MCNQNLVVLVIRPHKGHYFHSSEKVFSVDTAKEELGLVLEKTGNWKIPKGMARDLFGDIIWPINEKICSVGATTGIIGTSIDFFVPGYHSSEKKKQNSLQIDHSMPEDFYVIGVYDASNFEQLSELIYALQSVHLQPMWDA